MNDKKEAAETISGLIASVTDTWDEPLDEVHDIPQIVNAFLASDWLASEIRKAKAEECKQISAHFNKLADLVDGPHSLQLATQYLSSALTVARRAYSHEHGETK